MSPDEDVIKIKDVKIIYSTSVFFIFVCKLSCSIDEEKASDVIFDVQIKSKILERIDLSDDFWETFAVQNKSLKKQVGLYEKENINKANVLAIAINPKEYVEK